MKNYRYVLFDLDGTLTESGEGIINSAVYALKKFGIKPEISTMTKGLNLASQATMMAVKPRPSTRLESMEWEEPPTSSRPARPQMAPEMIMVRRYTLVMLIPA